MTEQQQPAPGGPETEIESAEAFYRTLLEPSGTYQSLDALRVQLIEQRDAQIAAQARAQALRDAESKWGADHSWDCAGMIDAADCTCGWAIALAAAQEPASDPQPETVDGVVYWCACAHPAVELGFCTLCKLPRAASDERGVGT